jgi:hypothetical protein
VTWQDQSDLFRRLHVVARRLILVSKYHAWNELPPVLQQSLPRLEELNVDALGLGLINMLCQSNSAPSPRLQTLRCRPDGYYRTMPSGMDHGSFHQLSSIAPHLRHLQLPWPVLSGCHALVLSNLPKLTVLECWAAADLFGAADAIERHAPASLTSLSLTGGHSYVARTTLNSVHYAGDVVRRWMARSVIQDLSLADDFDRFAWSRHCLLSMYLSFALAGGIHHSWLAWLPAVPSWTVLWLPGPDLTQSVLDVLRTRQKDIQHLHLSVAPDFVPPNLIRLQVDHSAIELHKWTCVPHLCLDYPALPRSFWSVKTSVKPSLTMQSFTVLHVTEKPRSRWEACRTWWRYVFGEEPQLNDNDGTLVWYRGINVNERAKEPRTK